MDICERQITVQRNPAIGFQNFVFGAQKNRKHLTTEKKVIYFLNKFFISLISQSLVTNRTSVGIP